MARTGKTQAMPANAQLTRSPFQSVSDALTSKPFVQLAAMWTSYAFFVRETFAGPARYYIFQFDQDWLWFLPDYAAIALLIYYLIQSVFSTRLSPKLVLLTLTVASVTGLIVSRSELSWLSGIKLFCAAFVGLFLPEDFFRRPSTKILVLVLLLASIVGIYLSSTVTFPWVDKSVLVFGQQRVTSTSRYFSGFGSLRFYGFASDNNAAAINVLIEYVLVVLTYRRTAVELALLPFAAAAIVMTTSRTTEVTFAVFVAIRMASQYFSEERMLSRAVRLTPLLALVPPIMVTYFMLYSQHYDPNSLFGSVVARGIDTWVRPFQYLFQMVPTSIFTGFGIGGIGSPMQFSDWFRPYYAFSAVDNFILFNFFMFGPLSVLLPIYAPKYIVATKDAIKMAAYVVITLCGTFILGYGDALFVLLYGYCVSSML
jgi:hypothetical protein